MRQGLTFKRCTDGKCGARVPDKRCPKCGGSSYSWYFMVDVAPVGAPRRQRKKGGFATKAEALAAMALLQGSIFDGTHVAPHRQTVGGYLTGWLAGMRGEYRPGTHDAARLHIEVYIVPRIGDVPLQSLSAAGCKALYAELGESGRVRGGGGLGRKTVHNVHRTLSRALNDAVADQLIPRNPAAKAHKAPESPEQPRWRAEQLRAFYASVADDRLFALWRLAGGTGLRPGELAGLRWRDVDLDTGRIAAVQQHAKGGGGVQAGRLKGKRGRPGRADAPLERLGDRVRVQRPGWP